MKSEHTRTGVRGIWCWRRLDAHQRTSVQLEPVTPHAQCHLANNTRTYLLLELRCRWWRTGAVYLRVISVQVWAELVFVDQPQQVRRVQHEQDRSEDRPLWNSETVRFLTAVVARSDSAVTPRENKVQLTLIGNPLRAFQWAQDDHRTLPQRGTNTKRPISL